MCGFTFTVFLSAFQLFPTAPFRILELGGSTFASGLFLGLLTYASATSAPLTGAVADRIGRRRTLLVSSGVILLCAIGYGAATRYQLMLALVVVHGVFWSGLLSASAAYLTNLLPERRRAEGIGYWGLSSVAAIAVSPPIAFWIMQHGGWRWVSISCGALNALMGAIAWTLPDESPAHQSDAGPTRASAPAAADAGATGTAAWAEGPGGRAAGVDPRVRPGIGPRVRRVVEWRVLLLSVTLFMYSYGYGAITSFSAMFADALGVSPKSLYLTLLAVVILLTRPLSGALADRVGYRRVFMPCLVLIALGLAVLANASSLAWFAVSAIVFGLGFGTAYPVFVAFVMRDVHAARRGAAFGAILAAFDTGIGTGSSTVGWLIDRFGFSTAFGVAAALSAIALPYFVVVERRLR